MQLGLSTYTYTWAIGVHGSEPEKPMTVFDLIERTNSLGVKVLQIADNLPLEKFSIPELEQIKQFADHRGIRIEVGARWMTFDRLKMYLNIARMMDSPILRFVIDGSGFEPNLEEIHSIIGHIVPELEKLNICLVIENHDRLLSREFVEIVQRSGSKNVGICLDTVNSMGAGEGLETVIGLLAPFTMNLHVKEFSIRRVSHKMGFVIEGVPLGKGMLPVAELISRVSSHCQSAILEQWTPPEPTIQETIKKENEWAEESILYLKSVLT
jgi:sugar phosphate isomerase/epimerase